MKTVALAASRLSAPSRSRSVTRMADFIELMKPWWASWHALPCDATVRN